MSVSKNFLFHFKDATLRPWQAAGNAFLGHPSKYVHNTLTLSNTSWTMNMDENWLIIGANGSGKSLITKALANKCQVLPAHSLRINHQYIGKKKSIAYVTLEQQIELMRQCQVIRERGTFNRFCEDDLRLSMFLKFNVDTLNFKPDLKENGFTVTNDEDFLLSKFRLKHKLNDYIYNFSSGEFRKLLIIFALKTKPRLLVLDEVFDGLDVESRSSLKDSLNGMFDPAIENEHKTNLILISHRWDEIEDLRCLTNVLQLGRVDTSDKRSEYAVIWSGSISQYQANQKCDLSSQLDHTTKTLSSFLKVDLPESPDRKLTSDPIVAISDLQIFNGKSNILHIEELVIQKGESLHLQGPNGVGKSLLLKVLSNNLNICWSLESVKINGRSLREINENRTYREKHIGSCLVSSQSDQISKFNSIKAHRPFLRVQEYLNYKQGQENIDVIQRLNLDDIIAQNKLCTRLSQGEQRKLYLCKKLITAFERDYQLFLLDEPFHGLDSETRKNLLYLIEILADQVSITDSVLVLVTHQSDEVPINMTKNFCLSSHHN